ncbi:hypothetical protein Nepgr_033903 [Nepenthes gracilis]|uniref:Uncharacterized protein n=1 Tax=Nepenthes gracilis TaxID=150966 RepID=A0AAD3TMT9_NEPGR|nr:hypothetical protein Nepgr_033903 [Nepenthes gracilis]
MRLMKRLQFGLADICEVKCRIHHRFFALMISALGSGFLLPLGTYVWNLELSFLHDVPLVCLSAADSLKIWWRWKMLGLMRIFGLGCPLLSDRRHI